MLLRDRLQAPRGESACRIVIGQHLGEIAQGLGVEVPATLPGDCGQSGDPPGDRNRSHPPVPGERLSAGRRSPLGIKMGLNRGAKRILPYV
jgi:hypothetical protein